MKKDHPVDTLTPQRKHRKLLKDGSGVEVWPESIEKTFVQGLREYWQSPYATYSQSRGRSRWRNQFLVDYLQRHGIQRTKKQVASHIQVLRNMWKGQPEFHLVAGGDEQVDPVTHIPIKEEQSEGNGLIPFDWDDREGSYSHSASPDFSPADSQSDFPLTPEQHPSSSLYPADSNGFGIKQEGSPGSLYFHSPAQIASPSTSPFADFTQQLPMSARGPNFTHPASATAFKQMSPAQPHGYPYPHYSSHPSPLSRFTQNRVTSFCLWADGMTPFTVNIDALHQSTSSSRPFTLRIKLAVPALNDGRSPATLHGFSASATLATPWSSSTKCTTKVFTNQVFVLESSQSLQVGHVGSAGVQVVLPESDLTRCRWLDPNTPTTLTQEVSVDDQVVLHLIYDLDRKNGPMPSAELSGFNHYKPTGEKSHSSSSSGSSTSSGSAYSSRRVSQPSLSYAYVPDHSILAPSIPMSR